MVFFFQQFSKNKLILQKGGIGNLSIFIMIILLTLFAYNFAGNNLPITFQEDSNGADVKVNPVSNNSKQNALQLFTFNGEVIAPTDPPTPPPNSPTNSCTLTPLDVMIIFDRSGSMSEGGGSKLRNALSATKSFVDNLSQNNENRVGLSIFSENGDLLSGMTNDFSSIKQKLDTITASGSTCIHCGIDLANIEIAASGRDGIKKVIILLSDGSANRPKPDSLARQKTLDSAFSGYNQNRTAYHTIGYGDADDEALLRQISTLSSGQFYSSPTESDLPNVFSQIGGSICK